MSIKSKESRLVLVLTLLCVFCILAIFLTSGIEGLHECSGDNCRICALITIREHVMNGLFVILCVFGAFILGLFVAGAVELCGEPRAYLSNPVFLKVKLSN